MQGLRHQAASAVRDLRDSCYEFHAGSGGCDIANDRCKLNSPKSSAHLHMQRLAHGEPAVGFQEGPAQADGSHARPRTMQSPPIIAESGLADARGVPPGASVRRGGTWRAPFAPRRPCGGLPVFEQPESFIGRRAHAAGSLRARPLRSITMRRRSALASVARAFCPGLRPP